MATAGAISSVVSEVAAGTDTVLGILEQFDPAAEVPAEAAGAIVDEVASLATKALAAWSAASGTPLTADAFAALLPNQTPLSLPDEPAAAPQS